MESAVSEKVPTREEFAAMAARGRLWQHEEPTPCTPTEEKLKRAQTPLDFGRAYGYSEDASPISTISGAAAMPWPMMNT